MRFLESLAMGALLAAFALVLIASVVLTFVATENDRAGTGVGILAAGCVIALGILLHGAMTRQPPKD